ncbi:hypothetical protein [Paenibacillus sp. FSL R7-0652]|uniref:Uncharacterized protein n=1 Tax=Paenibacillus sp. AN1007 TaxID=3151385 RepID=A0AAU8NHA2_9BACL
MKKGLSVVLYPLFWILGALSILGGNGNSIGNMVLFGKDIATDQSYDGQAIYDQIERRNG